MHIRITYLNVIFEIDILCFIDSGTWGGALKPPLGGAKLMLFQKQFWQSKPEAKLAPIYALFCTTNPDFCTTIVKEL
jgi:hypothetical protein